MVVQNLLGVCQAEIRQKRRAHATRDGPGDRRGEDSLVHHLGGRAIRVPGIGPVRVIAVEPSPVQLLAVQQVHCQPGHIGRWPVAAHAGVDRDQCGHVHGQGQSELGIVQRPGRLDLGCGGHLVQRREAVARDGEHAGALVALRGQGRQKAAGGPGLVGVQDPAHRGPPVGGACHQQDPGRHPAPVQQGVLQQPGQVGEQPPVGVVDDHQHAGAIRQAQILAAGLYRIGVRTVEGRDHPPPGRGRLGRELGGQPGLACPARAVQPPGRQPRAIITPAPQLGELVLAAGEGDHGPPGIEHPAGQLSQPFPIRASGCVPVRQQVQREPVAEYVDIGADRPVGEPADSRDILHEPWFGSTGSGHARPSSS